MKVITALAVLFSCWAGGGNTIGCAGENFWPASKKRAVIRALKGRWSTVDKWAIEYEVGRSGVGDNYVHCMMAVGTNGRYYNLKTHGNELYSWKNDPFAEEVVVNDGVMCKREPFNRRCRESRMGAGGTLERSIGMNVVWRVIPGSPMVRYSLPNLEVPESPQVLGRALSAPSCRLLKGTRGIKGEECLVFIWKGENASRRMWVTKDDGLCLMKEEIRSAEDGRLIQRIITRKKGVVAKEMMMPIVYDVQWFASTGELAREARVRILHCGVESEVSASKFDLTHLPGAIRMNDQNGFTQLSGGGKQLLLDMVKLIRQTRGLSTRRSGEFSAYRWASGSLLCGVGLGMLFSMCYGRVMKGRRPGRRNNNE